MVYCYGFNGNQTMWSSMIDLTVGLRYRAIADAIREATAQGDLRPGDPLPTHRALADQLGVTVGTVSRAYSLAADWGLVTARVGAGTFVGRPAERKPTNPWVIGQTGSSIDFGLLYPAALTDTSLRERCFDRSFNGLGRELLHRAFSGYSPELGEMSHRVSGADWLCSAGIDTLPVEVFVSDGGQSAFMTLFSALLRPGASVLVEELPYLGVKHLCAAMHLNLVAVGSDSEGMIPERLRECARTSGAQVMVVTPTLQNPTGARMGRERRQRIVEVARDLNLSIIEDATFDRLYADTPEALVSLAPERTFHVASFSKMVQPAMRVAFTKAPADRMPVLESLRHSLNIGGPSLQAEIVSRWIQTGLASELCQWQRGEVDRRWKLAAAMLPGFVAVDAIPAPFAWLTLPEGWRASDFAGHLRQQGVIVIDSHHFAVGRAMAPDAVRVSLTTPSSDQEFKHGLTVIRQLLNSDPRPSLVSYR